MAKADSVAAARFDLVEALTGGQCLERRAVRYELGEARAVPIGAVQFRECVDDGEPEPSRREGFGV